MKVGMAPKRGTSAASTGCGLEFGTSFIALDLPDQAGMMPWLKRGVTLLERTRSFRNRRHSELSWDAFSDRAGGCFGVVTALLRLGKNDPWQVPCRAMTLAEANAPILAMAFPPLFGIICHASSFPQKRPINLT
jgi:hypothetical protein